MRKKKKDRGFVELKWNGKKVKVFLDRNTGWEVIALENQFISREEKVSIIKIILTAVEGK